LFVYVSILCNCSPSVVSIIEYCPSVQNY
jgi:hypothetical protein